MIFQCVIHVKNLVSEQKEQFSKGNLCPIFSFGHSCEYSWKFNWIFHTHTDMKNFQWFYSIFIAIRVRFECDSIAIRVNFSAIHMNIWNSRIFHAPFHQINTYIIYKHISILMSHDFRFMMVLEQPQVTKDRWFYHRFWAP